MTKTKSIILLRISIAYLAMLVLGLSILYRVFHLQTVEGAYWRSLSDSLTTRYVTIDADRGNIYASDGKL
ncbi:MAG: hypothetical protein ACK5QZ_00495, partial [Bacteroidota bacterium]